MGRNKEIGTTISLNHEVNIKGPGVKSRGTKAKKWPNLTTLTPDISNSFAAMLPTLRGGIPVSAGKSGAESPLAMAALGSLCAAVDINLTPASGDTEYLVSYANVLQRLMNGAYVQGVTLDEEKLRKMIIGLISAMLEKAGPAFASYKQVLMHLMENAALQDFMKGVQETVCAIIGDPVNANTGNFIYEKEDLIIKGRIPLRFKRFYNSIDIKSGTMGIGWRHNYEIQLFIEQDRYVILWEDGREEVYLRDKENGPEPLFGLSCRLKKEKENYLYESQRGLVYTFNSQGRLLKQEDLNGQGLWFTYDKKGRLSSVVNNERASLHYEYDSLCGLLWHVTDHTGRRITLTYELERLKEVENPGGQSYSYAYGSDNRISSIRNPNGIYVLRNSYDDKGRTTLQRFADGGKIQYDYLDDLSRTLVTEQNGNKVAYVHDEKFRNVKTIYLDGEENFCYNDRNQLISKTDKRGNRTRFSYDDKGNTTQIIFPDAEKHNMTYDAGNRLLVLSINGITKLKNAYDAKGNLVKVTNALGWCKEIEYDAKGNPIKILNPDGSAMLLDYDIRGNITKIIDGSGNCTVYNYDDCNRVIRMVDGNGNSTGFSFDTSNRITCVTNAAGKHRSYQYTENGKLKKVVDFNGAVTTREYNEMNHVKSIMQPDCGMIHMEYDYMQNVIRKVLPNGAEISYSYDKLNRLEQLTLATGGSIHYEYDSNGNRTAATDPNGNRTSMEYDERNRLVKITDPSGACTSYGYDMEGHLISITDACGNSHTYTYDNEDQLIKETDISGNVTSYTYNSMGNLICVIDPKKHKTIYDYKPGGILSKITYPDGCFEFYSYDKTGNLVRRENQNGEWQEFSYDCLNQLVKVTNNIGQVVSYTYNEAGKVTSMIDPMGHKTNYEYSYGGRLSSVVDAAGNQTKYEYDTMGELISIYRSNGCSVYLEESIQKNAAPQVQVTRFERNLSGKIETITNPLGAKEHYAYDLAGKLTLKTDQDGYETRYCYTPSGDIQSITYADGRSVAFAYNPLRQLIEVQDWLGKIQIEPDEKGRAKKVIDHKGREICYQWSSMGELESLIYPDGKMVSYEYNEWQHLSRLKNGEHEIHYMYDGNGRLREKNYSDGVTSSYQYNDMGLLSSLLHQKDGTILEEYSYTYDLLGNKTHIQKKRSMISDVSAELEGQISAENGTYKYQYDSLNRLTEVWKDRKHLCSYEYDAFGNRIGKQTGDIGIRYHYNAANQLIREEGIYPERSYQYDSRGNLTAILQGTKVVNKYIYDETNRLSAAFNSKGQAAQYQYDGLGNRVGMREYETLATAYIQDGLMSEENQISETDYLLDVTKQFHNLLEKAESKGDEISLQRYVWDDQAAFMTEKDTAFIYLQDEIGSTIRLLGFNEKKQTIYGYDEFGQDLYGTQGKSQPFGYTGYRKDNIADSYFAQAREYRAETGRFFSQDVVRGQMDIPMSLNRYIYCSNNPITLVDYNGLDSSMSQGDANATIFNYYYEQAIRAAEEIVQDAKDALDPSPEPRIYSLGVGDLSDSDYIGCMYLLNQNGAAKQGHAAMLLVKENGMSEFYSYAGAVEAGALAPEVGSNGYLSTHVDSYLLTEVPCNTFFQDRGTYADNVSHPGVPGEKMDKYTNGVYIPITDAEGRAMHDKAVSIRNNPGIYNLWSHNCNMVAQIILQAGGKDFAPDNFDWINTRPNSVYNNIVDEIINGNRPGWLYGELEKFNYQNGTITNCPTSS